MRVPGLRFGLAALAAVFLAFATLPALAYNIGSIEVSPDDPIGPGDPVSIDVNLWTPTSSAIFWGATEVSVVDFDVSITIRATTQCELSAPLPACDRAIGTLMETVDLGALPAGDYGVRVETLRQDYFLNVTTGDVGLAAFTVVPEPGTAGLLGLGLALLAGRRGHRR